MYTSNALPKLSSLNNLNCSHCKGPIPGERLKFFSNGVHFLHSKCVIDAGFSKRTSTSDTDSNTVTKVKLAKAKNLQSNHQTEKASLEKTLKTVSPQESQEARALPYLPSEIMLMIFGNLGFPHIAKCSTVCSHWKALVEDDNLWKKIRLKLRIVDKDPNRETLSEREALRRDIYNNYIETYSCEIIDMFGGVEEFLKIPKMTIIKDTSGTAEFRLRGPIVRGSFRNSPVLIFCYENSGNPVIEVLYKKAGAWTGSCSLISPANARMPDVKISGCGTICPDLNENWRSSLRSTIQSAKNQLLQHLENQQITLKERESQPDK